jgi:phosphoglycerate dehydrogenase-like enzyme
MSFRVGITSDLRSASGAIAFADEGLAILEAAGLEWGYLSDDATVISGAEARECDALLVFAPRVTRETLVQADRLAIVARVGVGIDNVDLDACRDHGVLVTITPDAVRRPMASAAFALILALAHRLTVKDMLVRRGRWHDRFDHVGVALLDRTLGLIGFGNIGREIGRIAGAFGMRVLAHSPRLTAEAAAAAGADRADLDQLLQTADVVCIACPLTSETWHLIDADRIALMKESAFLVNISRGAIVDQEALVEALASRRIAGAGLDVFEEEPPSSDDPLLRLDNVVLAPHALGHVDRLFVDGCTSACNAIAAVSRGEVPEHVVDRAVVQSPNFRAKGGR